MNESSPLIISNPKYICPVHGEVDNNTIHSTIPGHEMRLCMRCFLEKMFEIGVQKVKEKSNE